MFAHGCADCGSGKSRENSHGRAEKAPRKARAIIHIKKTSHGVQIHSSEAHNKESV
jgi:hypothetical protein